MQGGGWIMMQVACFGDVAERIAASVTKGSRVYCEGGLRLEKWANKEGRERTTLSVAAWRVDVLGQIGRNKLRRAKRAAEDEGAERPLETTG